MPYLDYCCESWSSATEGRSERLEQWYRRAIELGNPEGTAEVSLKNRIHRNISIMTFKCVNNLAPPYLQNRFSLVKVTHEKNTRSSDSKRIYILNNVMGKWKHYPSNSEAPPSGTVYRQLSLVSKVSCSSNLKLRNWYNINIEYWLFTQTSNFMAHSRGAFSRERSTQPPPRCQSSDRNKLYGA